MSRYMTCRERETAYRVRTVLWEITRHERANTQLVEPGPEGS